MTEEIIRRKLAPFDTNEVDWSVVLAQAQSLSPADLVRVSEEAAKNAVLSNSKRITTESILSALKERKAACL